MRLSIGRILMVRGGVAASNGADRAPAIVTRVHAEGTNADPINGIVYVNATVFCDLGAPQIVGTVAVFESEADVPAGHDGIVAFWPPRV